MARRFFSYKWTLIGTVVIIGLNLLMQALLADPVKTSLLIAFPGTGGVLLFVGIIAFVSFFVGGALIGRYSPGETIREPAVAAAIAVGFKCVENFRNIDGQNFTVVQWMIGSVLILVVGFGMALAGAWVGEKIQGPTREKQLEAEGINPDA